MHPRDQSVLCSSYPMSLADLLSPDQVPQQHEVFAHVPASERHEDGELPETLSDCFGASPSFLVCGTWLSLADAARRRAAFKVSFPHVRFDWP